MSTVFKILLSILRFRKHGAAQQLVKMSELIADMQVSSHFHVKRKAQKFSTHLDIWICFVFVLLCFAMNGYVTCMTVGGT